MTGLSIIKRLPLASFNPERRRRVGKSDGAVYEDS